jgi:PAS domain-containing protein
MPATSGELETRIRRYDGEYRWFLIRVVPQLDAEGNVVRWFGSNTDIEDRKRAEKKLLEEERELRRITDAIPQTIVVQEPSGHPLYADQAALDYTGLSMQDVVTSDFRARIFHPEDIERWHEERQACVKVVIELLLDEASTVTSSDVAAVPQPEEVATHFRAGVGDFTILGNDTERRSGRKKSG